MPRGQRRLEMVKKSRHSAAGDREESTVTEFVGCPVLDPIQCQCPKEEVNPLEGVKMTCTWESCPYSEKPLHAVCYQLLEDNLVRRLATLGSARGWTVPQRRNNLWERKGQSLIGKFCRCRCDRGQMTRDKQALYEKEKAVEKEKKKKAKKAKQLPQLQFNSKPTAALDEKKKDGVFSPSAVSNYNNRTFSTRSRLHTDRSTSSMHTYTVGRTWSESSFAGETNGQYDNNEGIHPSDCDCVFHYDYDADDDHENENIDIDMVHDFDNLSDVIVPAPLPPPQEKSYAATIKSQDKYIDHEKKSIYSPDSGIGKTPRLSMSSSSESETENRQESVQHLKRNSPESLNPLGLSILSPVEVSSQEENNDEESARFIELTETPRMTKKRESIRVKKSISVSKLPLAQPVQLVSDDAPCGFSFNAPVREMMDIWHEATASASKCAKMDSAGDNKENEDEIDHNNWTPFFGKDFNLGEKLYYFP